MDILRSHLPTDEQTFMSGFSDYLAERFLANDGQIPMPFPTYEIYRLAAERGESIVIVEDPTPPEPPENPDHVDPTPLQAVQPVRRIKEPIFVTSKTIFKRRW